MMYNMTSGDWRGGWACLVLPIRNKAQWVKWEAGRNRLSTRSPEFKPNTPHPPTWIQNVSAKREQTLQKQIPLQEAWDEQRALQGGDGPGYLSMISGGQPRSLWLSQGQCSLPQPPPPTFSGQLLWKWKPPSMWWVLRYWWHRWDQLQILMQKVKGDFGLFRDVFRKYTYRH